MVCPGLLQATKLQTGESGTFLNRPVSLELFFKGKKVFHRKLIRTNRARYWEWEARCRCAFQVQQGMRKRPEACVALPRPAPQACRQGTSAAGWGFLVESLSSSFPGGEAFRKALGLGIRASVTASLFPGVSRSAGPWSQGPAAGVPGQGPCGEPGVCAQGHGAGSRAWTRPSRRTPLPHRGTQMWAV